MTRTSHLQGSITSCYSEKKHAPGDLPYKNYGGTRRKFWKEPLRSAKILFCGCGLNFFSPLRGTNFKTTHFSCHIFFRLNTLKDAAKDSIVDLLSLNTLRGAKTTFLTRKKYDEQPPSFLYGTPPWGVRARLRQDEDLDSHYLRTRIFFFCRKYREVIDNASFTTVTEHF